MIMFLKWQIIRKNLTRQVKLYLGSAFGFLVFSLVLSCILFAPPIQNPPKGPIYLGATDILGNSVLNGTNIIINFPRNTIDIQINFLLKNETPNGLFINAILPFTISNISSVYPILFGSALNEEAAQEVGTYSCHYMNSKLGSSALNATMVFNQSFSFLGENQQLGLGITANVDQSLYAIEDLLGSSKTAIFTFFGDTNGIWEDSMFQITESPETFGGYTIPLRQPLTVHLALPRAYYYSGSQPAPIEYYVNKDARWAMFSIDFLGGNYAQTLVCSFYNPTYQTLRDLFLLLIGAFSALLPTFALEAYNLYKNEKDSRDLE